MPPIVACWTKLTIPTSRTIEDETSEDGKQWRLAGTYHNQDKTPGYMAHCFGRMVESPDTVWYITAWKSPDSRDEFEKSQDYLLQLEEHTKLSSTPPETRRYDVDGSFWMYISNKNMNFLDAFFPASISDEHKQIAYGARGLVYHGVPVTPAYSHRPARGWLHGTQEYEGQSAVVLRFWHFWKSEESERDFKGGVGILKPLPLGYVPVYEYLTVKLRKAGLLGIEEFHCPLERMLDYYEQIVDNPADESEENQTG